MTVLSKNDILFKRSKGAAATAAAPLFDKRLFGGGRLCYCFFWHAALKDAEACAEIYRPYVEKTSVTFEYTPPDKTEIARRMDCYTPTFPWIVAQAGEKVIGYAYGSPQNIREAYQWNVDLAIYLHEEARGRGDRPFAVRLPAGAFDHAGILSGNRHCDPSQSWQ